MKNYKKVQMVAKNAPTGSYAAGCPSHNRDNIGGSYGPNGTGCLACERTK